MPIPSPLHGPHVSEPTRQALQTRLDTPHVTVPRCLTPVEFATLQSACARLFPDARIDIAGPIDARLAKRATDGWRYDALPDDLTTLRLALAALDAAALTLSARPFTQSPPKTQDAILHAVQSGDPPGPAWPFPPQRFFEDVLAESTEIYFAHPLAQDAIGYAGMADQPGWTRIGLDEREDREP